MKDVEGIRHASECSRAWEWPPHSTFLGGNCDGVTQQVELTGVSMVTLPTGPRDLKFRSRPTAGSQTLCNICSLCLKQWGQEQMIQWRHLLRNCGPVRRNTQNNDNPLSLIHCGSSIPSSSREYFWPLHQNWGKISDDGKQFDIVEIVSSIRFGCRSPL